MKKRLDVLLVERGLAESRAQAPGARARGSRSGLRQARAPGRGRRRARRERAAAVRLARRREARERSRRPRRRAGRARLHRPRRVDGRLHRLPAAARRGARDRASTSATASSTRSSATTRASPCSSGRTRASCASSRSRPICSSATSRSSACDSVVPAVLPLLAAGWDALVLVKPQFEAGRADVGKGGVVRDPEVHRRVLRERRRGRARLGSDRDRRRRLGLPGPEGQPRVLRPLHRPTKSPCCSMTSTTESTPPSARGRSPRGRRHARQAADDRPGARAAHDGGPRGGRRADRRAGRGGEARRRTRGGRPGRRRRGARARRRRDDAPRARALPRHRRAR